MAERIASDPATLDRARARVARWLSEGGPVAPRWAALWRDLLDRPERLAEALVADTERMRDLRQCTPFAGVVSPREWWAIVREVREQEAPDAPA